MNARQEAIIRLGGACAWCGSTDRLELDHLDQGTGNAHRRLIETKLEYWLKRQGYPAGLVQVLCTRCHDLKLNRRAHLMPIKQSAKDLHVGIDANVERQLSLYVAQKDLQKGRCDVTRYTPHPNMAKT